MPYNPSSAYPRHSTYTPPVYGREYARAFNEPQWGRPIGRAPMGPAADVGHAISSALTRPTSEHIGIGMEAMARRGIIAAAQTALVNRGKEKQQRARSIAAGLPPARPLAESSVFPQQVPPEPKSMMNTAMRSRGGRKVLGNINERLGDIAQREEASTAMDQVVNHVVNTPGVGGSAKLPPVFRFGPQRGGT